jgi:hypothetical protein
MVTRSACGSAGWAAFSAGPVWLNGGRRGGVCQRWRAAARLRPPTSPSTSSSTYAARRGSAPSGSAAANVALRRALALSLLRQRASIAAMIMITHAQRPRSLHAQGIQISAPARWQRSPGSSRTCFMHHRAARLVGVLWAAMIARCQIIKRGSNSASFSAASSSRAASGSGDVLCRRWAG